MSTDVFNVDVRVNIWIWSCRRSCRCRRCSCTSCRCRCSSHCSCLLCFLMVVDGVVVIGTTVVVAIATIGVIIAVVVVLLSFWSLSLLSSSSSCSFCQCLNQIYEKIPEDLKLNPATKRFYCFFQKSAFCSSLTFVSWRRECTKTQIKSRTTHFNLRHCWSVARVTA